MAEETKQKGQWNEVVFPNCDEIRMMISSYNQSATQLKNFYLTPSYMGLLNVGRKELQHSRFLAWLFDKNFFDQNSANSPLFFLLDIAMKRAVMQKKIGDKFYKEDLYREIEFRKFDIIDSSVKLEDHFTENNGKQRSVDILVRLNCKHKTGDYFDLLICIENKVLSTEHDDQTEAYYNHYSRHVFGKNKSKNEQIEEKQIYIYITPLSSSKLDDYDNIEEKQKCNCENFIQINYQDIVDLILEPLIQVENKYSQKYFIIDDYIKTLRYPILEDKDNKRTIMATSTKEIDLLTDFWTTNHELIELAISALGYNTTNDLSSAANEVSKYIDVIQAKTEDSKDNRKFIIKNEERRGPLGKITVAKEFARRFVTSFMSKIKTQEKNDSDPIDELNDSFRKQLGRKRTIYFVYDDQGSYLEDVGSINGKSVYFKAGVWGQTGPNWPPLEELLKRKDNGYFEIVDYLPEKN